LNKSALNLFEMNNLSNESEFRFIVQWFCEWSELQRDDFVPVLVEYLTQDSTTSEIHMNGMVNSIVINDKPMSLFQCRIKLFREWSPKWPIEFRHKLKEKIIEMDSNVGEKIINEIKIHNGESNHLNENGNANGTTGDEEVNADAENNIITVDDTAAATVDGAEATAIVVEEDTEEKEEHAINVVEIDNRLAEVLNNETAVDDNNDAQTDHVAVNVTQTQAEPADQVQMQTQQNVATVVVTQTVTNNAEVPSVA